MYRLIVLALYLMLGTQLTQANSTLVHQKDAQIFMQNLIKNDHFDRYQLQKILAQAVYQPQIIASMQRPYEKQNWDIYRALFLTQERLDGGLNFWKKNRDMLAIAEREYGVPAEVIVAVLGVETLYGKRQGNYRVLDALTTLAFYYPPRAAFFKKELREFLLLCRQHQVAATDYMGSYAGAMGKPQFMPSSYRLFARAYQDKHRPNLMTEDRDVILSVANYLQKHGWQPKQLVAEKPKTLATKPLVVASQLPLHDKNRGSTKSPDLLTFTTAIGAEYWLAYPNFYVITTYNTSPQYALVVHLLAKSLRKHYAPQTV